MLNPEALARLRSFRPELYDDLGYRQDSLFELMDAVLTAPERRTLVRLSVCACFRRRWPSTCDALADGTIDVGGLRALFRARVPLPGPGERPIWVVDGTHWPRPAAATSPDRTREHRPLPGKPQQGVVPAWAYHWLVQVPEVEGSWVLPLEVQRRGPTAGTPTAVAIRRIARARASQAPDQPRPVVALDSAHDVGQLGHARLAADLVVRSAKHRVFRRAPGPYSGRGRPHTHGPVFKLQDARTHERPDRSASLEPPVYGTVRVDAWTDLHVQDAADAPFTVVRVQVEHQLDLGSSDAPATHALVVDADSGAAHVAPIALALRRAVTHTHTHATLPPLLEDADHWAQTISPTEILRQIGSPFADADPIHDQLLTHAA